jgi:hypothetical protein
MDMTSCGAVRGGGGPDPDPDPDPDADPDGDHTTGSNQLSLALLTLHLMETSRQQYVCKHSALRERGVKGQGRRGSVHGGGAVRVRHYKVFFDARGVIACGIRCHQLHEKSLDSNEHLRGRCRSVLFGAASSPREVGLDSVGLGRRCDRGPRQPQPSARHTQVPRAGFG